MVKVSAPTNQLIQIDATSTEAAEAQTLAQAVADSYVNYVRDTAREVTTAALADLNNRRDDLQTQINQLQKEIAATTKRQQAADPDSPEGREEAQLLAGLRTQQANLALQLDKVEDKIAAGTPVGSSATGTLVVQQATVAEGPSTLMRLLIWAPARCPGRHPARGRPGAGDRPSRPRGSDSATTSPTPSGARCWRRCGAGRNGRWRAGRRCSSPTR